MWRYHPTRQVFEAVAHGTTNPWGLDFDDYGQMFITNCVIAHLWHVIPGAHFQRMFGQDLNPYVYDLMTSLRRPSALGRRALDRTRAAAGAARRPAAATPMSGPWSIWATTGPADIATRSSPATSTATG